MKRANYIPTGEFAKLMGVTKHTLFHYDHIQLFCPDLVTEQGYRYYSLHQMENFNTILLLKDLGMSLDEIKYFMENRSPEQFLDIFKRREEQIDIQIARLNHTKHWMQQRRKKLEATKQQDWSQIRIQQHPERYYLFRQMNDTSDAAYYRQINELITEYEQLGGTHNYDIAYFQYATQINQGIYDTYDNIALLLDQKPPIGIFQALPAGHYLTAYHIGHWDTVGEAYLRLFAYQNSHQLHLSDVSLEYYVIDQFTANRIEDYVTEISIQILD